MTICSAKLRCVLAPKGSETSLLHSVLHSTTYIHIDRQAERQSVGLMDAIGPAAGWLELLRFAG